MHGAASEEKSSSDSRQKEYEYLSRVRKVCCLIHQAQKGLFAPSFCVHIPPLPLGTAPDPASLGQGCKEILYLKNDRCPPPPRGVRRELGYDTSEPVAAGSPLSAPALRRSGSTGGRTPLIPAGGITRHRRHHAAAEFSGGVGSCCWVINPVTGIVPILHSY